MQLKPLNEHVILEVLDEEKHSLKGIITSITEDQHKALVKAKVVAIGSGVGSENGQKKFESEIKLDDIVYVKDYSGMSIELESKKYKVVKYSDLSVVLKS